MEKKTSLYDNHIKLKGKIVPFAGYLLPVQYPDGIIEEHLAVRNTAGLFDVSHMGELIIAGKDALLNVNNLLTNDFTNMTVGQVRYSPMCNPEGGIVDDLIVYKLEEEKFLFVVNAANKDKDVSWIKKNLQGEVTLTDISDETALIALQGPNSKEILERLAKPEQLPTKYYSFTKDVDVGGITAMVSRTGYTGEHGYEIYINCEDAPALWDNLLETGKDLGLIPCGLGARDTLRFEAGLPLYGNEMNDEISPLEVGLNFAVKMQKEDFIGKDALETKSVERKRVGLEVVGRGIIREDAKLFVGDKVVGFTTSGSYAPYLEKALAMALVDCEYATEGTQVEAEVRRRRIPAKIVSLPFIKK